MGRHIATLPDLVIPNGAQESNVVSPSRPAGAAIDYVIYAPATLTGTVSVLVGPEPNMAFADLSILNVGGSDVTVPAGKAVVLPVAGFRSIALSSDAGEGAERTFPVRAQIEIMPSVLA